MGCRGRDQENGDNPVRAWHGEKIEGKSEAQGSNDFLQNGRSDKVECLGVKRDHRWSEYSMLGTK